MTTDLPNLLSAGNNFVLYTAPNGAVKVRVLFRDESVWLTQKGLAELFGVKVPAIAKHLKNIFESGELSRAATVSKMEIVQTNDPVVSKMEIPASLSGGSKHAWSGCGRGGT